MSKFSACSSNTSGGAIAAVDGAQFAASNSAFENNEADGLGGGALYSNEVLFFLLHYESIRFYVISTAKLSLETRQQCL